MLKQEKFLLKHLTTFPRILEIRPCGIAGRLAETWTMEEAKRARKAETLKQPSRDLRSSAPYFYPDPDNKWWPVSVGGWSIYIRGFTIHPAAQR